MRRLYISSPICKTEKTCHSERSLRSEESLVGFSPDKQLDEKLVFLFTRFRHRLAPSAPRPQHIQADLDAVHKR